MTNKIKHYVNRIQEGRLKEMKKQTAWIYRYARPNATSVVAFTLLGLSGTVVSLISSLVSRDLVDIITGHRTGELLVTFALMMGITLFSSFIGQMSSYLSTKIQIKIDNNVKADIFDRIMETEWESLNGYHSGELMARWSGDASVISNGVLNFIPNIIIYVFQFISALYMVVRYDASFAIFALAGVPVSLLVSRESMKRMQKGNMGMVSVNAKLSSFNQETFGNIQTVKAFDMVKLYSMRLRDLQKAYGDARLRYQKVTIINSIFLTVISMLVTYSAQGWGIYKVWKGDISYGTMTMFIALSATLTATVNNLINLVPNSIALTNAAQRLMDITEMPKEDYSKCDEVQSFYNKHKDHGVGIHIASLEYAYPGGENVLKNVNVDAYPREVVALVGPSGEGKTTMLRYMLSIIRGQAGTGYICGGKSLPEDGDCIEINASARQLMAYVPQGNTMFSGTIASNMRNVKQEATDEEIIEALKTACAWKFVEKLPDGIDSEIGERGGGFSEGQSQRLSIARALLRKSPILLLDEATSALDVTTEREVLKNIMKDEYPRTVIVTTHRPTVLSICDRVYAIRDKKCAVMNKEEVESMIADF